MLGSESVGHKTNLLRQWGNGSYFLNFSLHSLAMRFKIEKIRARFPTWLATIAKIRQAPSVNNKIDENKFGL